MGKSENEALDERAGPLQGPSSQSQVVRKAIDAHLIQGLRIHEAELEAQNRELRETHALLEESRNRYVDLYDFAPIGYFSLDLSGYVRECNLAAAALLGRPLAQILDKPLLGLVTVVDPEAFRRHLGSVFTSASAQSIELELVFTDRPPICVRMISQRARSYEDHLSCRTALVDVTERKRGEEALRFLAEVGTEIASSLDYRTTLSRVAHLAVPRLGDFCLVELVRDDGSVAPIAVAHVDPSKEPSLLELRRALPPDPQLARGIAHALRTGNPEIYPPCSMEETPLEPLDATHPAFLRVLDARTYFCLPLFARGKTLGTMTFAVLSPERRYAPSDWALAQALAPRCALAIDNARLYEDAQRAIRARQDLLAVVSHDLKNPLNAIGLSVQMLRSIVRAGEPAVSKRITSIEAAVCQMDHLIRELLDLSSIEAGHLTIDPGVHDLRAIVDTSMDLLRPLAAQRSLEILLELPEEDLCLACDAQRISRVFSNLVGNSIKFTPRGGRITISAVRLSSEVRIAVADTGSGIAGNRLPHVFERYWQAEETAGTGAGLGLFIAKAIVERHGGRIWAQSSVGRGSVFFFTVPLAPEASAEVHPMERPPSPM